jgi:hypothetical protein
LRHVRFQISWSSNALGRDHSYFRPNLTGNSPRAMGSVGLIISPTVAACGRNSRLDSSAVSPKSSTFLNGSILSHSFLEVTWTEKTLFFQLEVVCPAQFLSRRDFLHFCLCCGNSAILKREKVTRSLKTLELKSCQMCFLSSRLHSSYCIGTFFLKFTCKLVSLFLHCSLTCC